MSDTISILRPGPDTIVIRHSVNGARLQLLALLGGLALWYGFVIFRLEELWPVGSGSDAVRWAFTLLPILSLYRVVPLIRTIVAGRVYELNGAERTLLHNGRPVAGFDEVQRVQIRKMHGGSESETLYRLSLTLDGGSKVAIAQSEDADLIFGTADEIADLLGREVFLT